MTVITPSQYEVIFIDGFGYRKDIMDAVIPHKLAPVSLSAARANKSAGERQMLCPVHGKASEKCRTTWGIDTGNVAIYSFPCGCRGISKIRSAAKL